VLAHYQPDQKSLNSLVGNSPLSLQFFLLQNLRLCGNEIIVNLNLITIGEILEVGLGPIRLVKHRLR
jgi:hypothetical protein